MVGALVDDIHHQAVEYVDDAVGVLGDRRIVRNHDQRVVVALGHLLDEAENFLARAAVQVARRFVGKDDLRVGNERARNAHALLLIWEGRWFMCFSSPNSLSILREAARRFLADTPR